MTANRRVRFFFAVLLFVFLPVLASAANTEFRVLIDADNNAATGCTTGGMAGIDHVVVTLVRTDATSGAVNRSYRLACSGGAFGTPLDLNESGWGVGFHPPSGGMSVENRIAFGTVRPGGGTPVGMHLGFDGIVDGNTHSVTSLAGGAAIIYPRPAGRRRSAEPVGTTPRTFTLDGQTADWNGLEPIAAGIADDGTRALRMIRVYAFANASDNFVYFRIDANLSSDAPFAEDDEYLRDPGVANLNVPSPGVLGNDGDPNSAPLTALPVSPASHGEVTLNPDGSFTYTPSNPASSTTDSFHYKANNGTHDSNVAKVTIKVATGNEDDPVVPNANDDQYSTSEDTPLAVPAPGVLSNDTPPAANRKAEKLTNPTFGSVVVNNDGSFTYTPNPNFFGTDSFTYKLVFPAGEDVATVTITIESVNDTPVLNNAAFAVAENAPNGTVVGTVTGTDDDADTLSYAITGGNTSGAFAINATTGRITVANSGALDFETTPAFNLTVTVTDNGSPSLSDSATVTITLNDVNETPTAVNDSGSVAEDGSLNVPAPGLLANDVDPDGDGLTATKMSDPANGVATVSANGAWTYTPNANFNGTDSFTYRVNDGTENSNIATVTITVTAVNDTPVFTGGGNVAVDEDNGHNAPWATGISAGPADEAGQTLTFNVTNNNNALFSAQPLISSTGVLTFTPAPDANGTATVTVTLSDNGGGANTSAPQNFTITVREVNDAPTATNDANTTPEDTALAFPATTLTSNDSAGPANESGQTLTVTAVSATSAQGGTVTLVAGTVTYTPAANFHGTDTFTYTVTDNGTTNGAADPKNAVGTVTITVTSVNDTPSFTSGGNVTVNEDTPHNAPWATAISAGPSDESSQTLTFNVSNNNNPLFSVQPSISPSGVLTFTPAPNANGTATVTVTLSDNGGGANTSAAQNFTITVNEVNDAPTATNDANTTPEDTALVFAAATLTANDSAGPANESGQTLTVTGVSATSAQGGTVTLVAGTITYTPPANYFGPDSFTYTVTDNGTTAGAADPRTANGTVNITVTEVNDTPAATNDAVTATEETALNIPASSLTTNDSAGPNESTQTLTVTAVSPTSAQGGTVTLVAGTITYTPPASYNGPDSFTYTVTDNGTTNGVSDPKSAVGTVNVTVADANDAPTAASDNVNTTEDTPLVFAASTLTGNDSAGPAEEAGQTLTVTNVSATSAQGGTVTLVAGNITYTPPADYNGPDSFTYTVTDNGTTGGSPDPKSTTGTVNVAVSEVNDNPVAANDAQSTPEDTALIFLATTLTTNDSAGPANESSQSLTVTAVSAASAQGGTVTLLAGTITYTPPANYFGPDSFTYTVTDNGTTNGAADPKSANGTVNVTVTEVNDDVTAADDAVNATEDTALVFAASTLTANDNAGAGEGTQTLTVTSVSATSAQGGTVSLVSGNITYTPPANYNGADSFTYTVTDNGTTNGTADPKTDTATVNVTVSEVNDTPTAGNDAITTAEDTPSVFAANTLVGNDSAGPANEAGQTLTVSAVSATSAQGGTVTLVAGNITYTPPADYNGPDSFTYTVTDNGTTNGAADPKSANGTVNVTVTEVNDAPLASTDTQSTPEDTALAFGAAALTSNDSAGPANENTQTLTVTGVSATSTQGGTVTLVTGTVTYTPPANFFGTDTFTYTVTDNGTTNGAADAKSANGQVNVTVTAVNDDVAAADDAVNAVEDTPLVFAASTLTTNDSAGPNESTQTLTVTSVSATSAQGGTVTLVSGNITYTPPANYHGADSFTYTVTDDGTTNGASDPKNDTATVNVTVSEVNDTPTAGSDAITTAEDTASAFAANTLVGNDSAGPANESGQTLTVTGVSATSAQGGTVTLVAGNITYTPAANYNGPDSFTYTVTDNGTTSGGADPKSADGTVNVTVTEVNDTPVANTDAANTPEDTQLVFAASTLTTNDSAGAANESGQTLTVTAVSATSAQGGTVSLAGGNITYTPPANFSGADSFTYTVTDNGTTNGAADAKSANGTVNVTVDAVNDAPNATNLSAAEAYTEDTPLNLVDIVVSDIDSATITATLTLSDTAAGSLSTATAGTTTSTFAAGVWSASGPLAEVNTLLAGVTYNPAANYNSNFTVSTSISDGVPPALTGSKAFTGTAVNDAPAFTIAGDPPFVLAGSGAQTVNAFATGITDGDPELTQTLTFNRTAGATTGNIAFDVLPTIDTTTGNLTYTPTAGTSGTAVFNFTLSDDGATGGLNVNVSASQSFTIAVEVAPTVTSTTPADNATGVSTSTNITVNFSEPVSVTLSPASFRINCNAGADLAFAYVGGTTNVTTVTLDPTAALPAGNCVVTVVANEVHDTDPYDPPDGLAVDYVFDFVTNTPPTAGDDSTTALGHVTLTVSDAAGVLANDTDPDAGADMDVQNFGTPIATTQGGTITFTKEGGYTYNSQAGDQNLTDTVNYTVTDQFGGTDTGTLSINLGQRFIYVDDDHPTSTPDGRDIHPYKTMQQAQAGSAANDTILVKAGTYTDHIVLQSGQSLIGEGISANHSHTHNAVVFPVLTAGAAPSISRATAGDTITLSTNNTIRGVAIGSTNGKGIVGSNFTAVTINDNVTVNANGNAALHLDTGAVNATFNSVSANSGANSGLIFNALTGTLNINAGNISNTAGATLNLTGGSMAGTIAANFSTTGSSLINVASRTANALLLSGALSGSGTIAASGNAAGTTLTFSGTQTLNTGGNVGVNLSANPGTISFTGGALQITTTTGAGFIASGATGNVNVTGANNTITTGTGIPLQMTGGVDIDASGVTFRSISANGAASGIVLADTGANAFTLAGTGTAGTGGTLQSIVGSAVSLTNTDNVNLNHLTINGAGTGITGSSFGTLTLRDLAVTAVSGLSLTTGTVNNAPASTAFTSLTTTGGTNGVAMTGVNGTFNVAAGTLSGATGSTFLVSGGNVGGTWATDITQGGAGAAVQINTAHTGAITFSGTVNATNGTGLQFDNADGNYQFTGAATLSGGAGIDVLNNSGGTFNFDADSSIGSTTNELVTINASAPTFTYSGSFTKNAAGVGINISNNTGGTIVFDGNPATETKSLTTSTGNAINLSTNNAATTVRFTNGGLALSTTTGRAVHATSGGSLEISGANNTANSTGGGVTVFLNNTTIHANGVTFYSVSNSGGAANGINLTTTGAGPFTVTGDGAASTTNSTRGRITAKEGGGTVGINSGGTITGTTGAGFFAQSTGVITLRNMTIQDAGGITVNNGAHGVHAQQAAGLTLDNVLLTSHDGNCGLYADRTGNVNLNHVDINSNATLANTENTDKWNVRIDDLTGTSTWRHSLFYNSRENVVGVQQGIVTTNPSMTLNINNCEFRDVTATSPGNVTFQVINNQSANSTVSATGSLFQNARSTGFQWASNQSSGGSVTVTSNTFNQNGVDIDVAHQGSNDVVYNITGNTTRQTFKAGSSVSINLFLGGTSLASAELTGTISGNTIGNAAVANSGSDLGIGLQVDASGAGTLNATVSNNTIRQIKQDAAFGSFARHTAKLNLLLTNNNFRVDTASGLSGFYMAAGTSAGDTPTVCIDQSANSFVGSSGYFTGFDLTMVAGNPTVKLRNYGGANNDTTAIQNFINSANTLVSPGTVVTRTVGTITTSATACVP